METTPKPDMRGVQYQDGLYRKRTGDLCERCGVMNVCQKPNRTDAEFVVSECKEFHPVLMFSDPRGTEDEFTTIRLGDAWSKRLKEGSIVSLMDKNGIYGKAVVTAHHSGDKEVIIIESIWTNHLMIDFKGPVPERIEKMTKIVRNAYGNLIWKNNNRATILFLRRLE